jgi:hypothetical protein
MCSLQSTCRSFASTASGSNVNQLLIQPFVNYNFPDGCYLTSSPIVTANLAGSWAKMDSAGGWPLHHFMKETSHEADGSLAARSSARPEKFAINRNWSTNRGLAAKQMTACGPMRTSRNVHFMSASEGKADVEFAIADIRK